MSKMKACCLIALLIGAAATVAFAGAFDWPQWQGPNRDAMSSEKGLLKEWPKDGPPLAWKLKGLGGGYGEVAVVGGRIYGMSTRGDKEFAWAISEEGGKPIWSTALGVAPRAGMPQGKEGPGCTPTVDGDRLYVIGNGGDFACLQTSDGKIAWQHSLTRDFGGSPPTWSYRESPLVDGEKVMCTPGAADAMMVALDKKTGNVIWKTPTPATPAGGEAEAGGGGGRRGGRRRGGGSGAAYSSAIAIDVDGVRQYVQFTAKALIGVAAADGKLLWQYKKPANGNAINISPPLYHDGMVFAASAYGAGGGLAKIVKEGDGFKAEEVWFSKKMQNHHGGYILVDGCLYGANGGNEGGALVCLDFKTGQVLWDQRSERRAPKGSIAFADDRLYYRCEDGTVLLIEPNAKQYVERGRFEQPDRSAAPDWSHPVIANGKLYLRDQDVLLCYDVKAK
jgi:outer membrane protein assembly factor BamB